MKEAREYLIELQKMELALRDIERRRKELPQQLASLAQDQRIFQAALEECRQKSEEAIKKRREKEDKLKREGETLKKTRERLYEVKTNKEYQAILKEIETAEAKISELESAIISILEEIDLLGKTLKPKEEAMTVRTVQYEQKKSVIERELAGIDQERQERLEQCEAIRKKVSAELLKKFDTIKAATAGVALTAVWKAVCGGCHMNIPAQQYIDLQKTADIAFCPNCQRIIYWYDQGAPVE